MKKLTDQEIKDLIQSLDFEMIINKMVSHQGWSLPHANEACRMYRNWLFLTAKYSDKKLPPSEEIDEFWHNHILDTQKYRKDCDTLFGRYMDHYPYFGIDDQSTMKDLGGAFAETQKLHLEEFGDYIYEVRSKTYWSFVSFLHVLMSSIRGRKQFS